MTALPDNYPAFVVARSLQVGNTNIYQMNATVPLDASQWHCKQSPAARQCAWTVCLGMPCRAEVQSASLDKRMMGHTQAPVGHNSRTLTCTKTCTNCPACSLYFDCNAAPNCGQGLAASIYFLQLLVVIVLAVPRQLQLRAIAFRNAGDAKRAGWCMAQISCESCSTLHCQCQQHAPPEHAVPWLDCWGGGVDVGMRLKHLAAPLPGTAPSCCRFELG